MCRVPFIQRRLREKFGFDRVEAPEHAEWLIADGAAWIAHDELPLELAKPFELYHTDNTYVPILHEKHRLSIENTQESPVSLQSIASILEMASQSYNSRAPLGQAGHQLPTQGRFIQRKHSE
jgi:hypothetical protein